MNKFQMTFALLCTTFALSATGCDEAGTRGDAGIAQAPERGVAGGKADAPGSCAPEDCGGQASNGSCWCDEQCAEYGDCCADIAPVCEGEDGGAASGDSCDLLEGCAAGNYCAWSGEAQAGVCTPASELVAAAVQTVREQFPEGGFSADDSAVVTRVLALTNDDVMTGSSQYTVDLDAGDDRVAHVRFDLTGAHLDTWRAVPEALRSTAPWGNAEYIVPGTVQVTMDHAVTLDGLYDTFVGPALDDLTVRSLHRSHEGDLWFFDLVVPGFTELEVINKIADAEHVVEAWPNRINFVSNGHEPQGLEEIIAAF
ncbi:MAG: hypothetical protein AAF721_23915 [Myxococcota bacterium]